MDDNQTALLEVVKYELRSPVLNDENIEVTDDTVLNEILSETDGVGASNSKTIFESAIRWVIERNKLTGKTWPQNWIALSAKQFAETIVVILLLLMPFCSMSQLSVNLSAAKTDLRNAAVTIGISYAQSIQTVVDNKTFFHAGKNSSLIFYPDIDIETGTTDAFGAITAKFTGLGMVFKTTTVAGLVAPDLHRTFQTFPISIGIESNKNFSFINTVVEAGWVPYFPTVRGLTAGVLIQGGVKSKAFNSPDSVGGGAMDESAETTGDGIFRARGFFRVNSPYLVNIDFFKVGLIGSADGWYDMAHGAGYYKLEATARVYLKDGQYIDFVYQKGSGAPLFNTGNQFLLGLTLKF